MPRIFNFFLIFFTIVICFTADNIEAQTGQLPRDEGKKDLNFFIF